MRILDVATGEGFFALEIARLYDNVKIVGIDISRSVVREARGNVGKQNAQDLIEIVEMDAANMRFSEGEFDIAINFTGLEDIHMTRGKSGVQQTFSEVNRTLKPDSYFCFVMMPPDEMETNAQKMEAVLFSHVCGATWLYSKEYETMLEEAKFKLCEKRSYYTRMKFTPQQAKNEIKYIIRRVPKVYGISTLSFEEIWTRFGQDIEKNGLGCYSKVLLMIARKIEDVDNR
jgi:ubiquinone/menaquinone biosynthesis C-methylase UbiE